MCFPCRDSMLAVIPTTPQALGIIPSDRLWGVGLI